MDPITVIVAALAAGAIAALQETASLAVKEGYAGLKSLIQECFAGRPEAELALAKYEQKPDVWQAPLKDELAEAGVDKDPAVVQAASQLLKLVQPQQVARGKYNVLIGEAKGVVIGDDAHVTQTFGQE
jgi:hypothetical protein